MFLQKVKVKVTRPRKFKTGIDEAAEFLESHSKTAYKELGSNFMIEFRFIREKEGKKEVNSLFCRYEDIRKTLPEVFRRNEIGFDVYYGPNPRPGPVRGKKENIEYLTCLWADLDAEGTGREKKAEYKTIKDALAALGKFEYPVGFKPTTCNWPCAIKLAEKRVREGAK